MLSFMETAEPERSQGSRFLGHILRPGTRIARPTLGPTPKFEVAQIDGYAHGLSARFPEFPLRRLRLTEPVGMVLVDIVHHDPPVFRPLRFLVPTDSDNEALGHGVLRSSFWGREAPPNKLPPRARREQQTPACPAAFLVAPPPPFGGCVGMGQKYLPTIRDRKLAQRFQWQQRVRMQKEQPVVPPQPPAKPAGPAAPSAPAAAAQPTAPAPATKPVAPVKASKPKARAKSRTPAAKSKPRTPAKAKPASAKKPRTPRKSA